MSPAPTCPGCEHPAADGGPALQARGGGMGAPGPGGRLPSSLCGAFLWVDALRWVGPGREA